MLQAGPAPQRLSEEFCVYQSTEPCAVILFGASGDLAHRKLIPALFDLRHQHLLPPHFFLLGLSSKAMDDAAFRQEVAATLKRAGKEAIDASVAAAFTKAAYFLPGNFSEPATYQRLSHRLSELESQHKTARTRVFYLAIPPAL